MTDDAPNPASIERLVEYAHNLGVAPELVKEIVEVVWAKGGTWDETIAEVRARIRDAAMKSA